MRCGASQPASDRRIIMFIMLSYSFVRSVVKFCTICCFISGIQMVPFVWHYFNDSHASNQTTNALKSVELKILAEMIWKLINGYQHTKWLKMSECKRVIKNDSIGRVHYTNAVANAFNFWYLTLMEYDFVINILSVFVLLSFICSFRQHFSVPFRWSHCSNRLPAALPIITCYLCRRSKPIHLWIRVR